MMEDKCENCRYCAKLYVPPTMEFKDIPQDKYVCTIFWDMKETDHVQYLGDNQGMCEMFTERKNYEET